MGRHFFSLSGEKKSPAGEEIACGRRIARGKSSATLSFSSPSSSFSLPQLIPPKISRRRSKSIVTGRFRVVTGRKQPQSTVPLDSRRSAYQSANETGEIDSRQSIEGEKGKKKKKRKRRKKKEERRGEERIPRAVLARVPLPPAGRPRAVAALACDFSPTRGERSRRPVGVAHEERGNEQDEREVGYSPRAEEA
ncbi:hypothetical protein BHM03_00054605 [Ensete ventricosum]|nr:hypothetical protein BHM03_00054605 [Ensete ventricosum]